MPVLSDDDVMYRFLLPRAGVRGALVRLGASWREVAGRADYPPTLRALYRQVTTPTCGSASGVVTISR